MKRKIAILFLTLFMAVSLSVSAQEPPPPKMPPNPTFWQKVKFYIELEIWVLQGNPKPPPKLN